MVSSMGAGAKLDATAVRVADIAQTRMCPLAHMLRKRLHKFGIYTGFEAVFSIEEPRRSSVVLEESRNKKSQVAPSRICRLSSVPSAPRLPSAGLWESSGFLLPLQTVCT